MIPLILLVDDEDDILSFLERILKTDYSVIKAGNGKEALALLEEEAVHLVISDVVMPEMDGFQLCRQIKSRIDLAQIPVILLTASNTIQAKIAGLELGADAYIEKPFSREYLLAQVASLLYNRNKIREFYTSSPLAFIQSARHNRPDAKFMQLLEETISKNMDDPTLDVDRLAKLMLTSRITLYRKIKALCDLPPAELINIARLKKAAQLLTAGDYRVYEVSDKVGFNSPGSFARSFTRQFNMTPTEFVQSSQKESR